MTFQEQIGLWLANRAATDEEFKKDYSKKNKSLDECVKFIESKLLQKVLEQRKANKDNSEVSVSAPTDDEVYAMCLEYYHDDDIKVEANKGDFVKILSMSATSFTDEEKAKMRKEAEEDFKAAERKRLSYEKANNDKQKASKEATAKQETTTKQVEMKPTYKKKETKNDNPQQLSLF